MFGQTTISKIDYWDFESFVKEKYPELSEYDFVMVQECCNDTDHEFNVSANEKPFDGYDLKHWEEFIESKGTKTYYNHLLFRKLVLDGHIMPGNYLVNVSW